MLMGIAIIFLRNQVRPIERLARAADSFGKGRAVPDFKPYGATEVRRAAQAFITMRERIERHVSQRTEMLAGVSHDLKTPLTRLKLTLAMMPEGEDIKSMRADIAEMEHMLDDYLAFARGEGGEDASLTDLGELVREVAGGGASGRASGPHHPVTAPDHVPVSVKRAGAAALPGEPDRQCPQAWRQGGGDLDAGTSGWWKSRSRMTAPAFPNRSAKKPSGPFIAWMRAATCKAAAPAWAWPSPATSPAPMAVTLSLDKSALGGLKATIRLPV